MSNEFYILIFTSSLLLMTDYVLKIDVKELAGWFHVISICLVIASNVSFQFFVVSKTLKYSCKKHYYKYK
jgi:hypothetical protein